MEMNNALLMKECELFTKNLIIENITSYTISMYINVPSDKVVSYGWQLMISY